MNEQELRERERKEAEVTDVEEAPPASLPTIWECRSCGTQIQVVISPDRGRAEWPFKCVCGAEMDPGKEWA